jgi:hypothetical protein
MIVPNFLYEINFEGMDPEELNFRRIPSGPLPADISFILILLAPCNT